MTQMLSSYFIDVKEVLEDLRLEWPNNPESNYNSSALTRMKPRNENIMFCCPHHAETNPSCGIRTDYPYGYNCFGCGASGDLVSLVTFVIGLNNILLGEQYIRKNYLITSSNKRKPIDMNELLDGTELDRKRSKFEEDVTKYTKKRHNYIVSRGFSDRTIRKYEVGYDEETQAVTFPVRTSKGLVRFIKRRFVSKKGFLNEENIDKKDIVYGLYYIMQSPNRITNISLNESETDTMACYEGGIPAGAILGRLLFKEQVRELLLAGIKEIDLFYDNDKHGFEATLKSYKLLEKTPIRVNVTIYPGGHWGINSLDDMPYKDSNDLLKANRLRDREVVPFETFMYLVRKAKLVRYDENGNLLD